MNRFYKGNKRHLRVYVHFDANSNYEERAEINVDGDFSVADMEAGGVI